MLESLSISNIALIEQCQLTLEAGLNILSGETGAGKSIIIDSLTFVLGGRADKSLIRHGQTAATVEAVFTHNEALAPVMEELGLEVEDTIIIRRTMTETRNDVRVNGMPFTLAMLKRLTNGMVDIHGQHEHQSLLRSQTHLGILDRYAEDTAPLRAQVAELYHRYQEAQKQLSAFGDERERERRLENLRYMIDDIEKVSPQVGEEDKLLAERERMRNAERIVSGVSACFGAIDGGDGIGANACLSLALSSLRSVMQYDEQLAELADRLDSARIEIDDISDSLSGYMEGFDFDQRSFDRVERRVDELKRLRRKYGATIEDVLVSLDEYREELDKLEGASGEIERLTAQVEKLGIDLYNAAVKLSKARQKHAEQFSASIMRELDDLAMKGTTFCVDFAPIAPIEEMDTHITANGLDEVEFLISPNKGEPLKPLARIASGGEMSRFMLALKNIIAGLDSIDTLVFDEIDTGISGVVAHTVAQKLYNISRSKQVIAVTHLPQLASFADHHYLINKYVEGDKTHTKLVLLEGDARTKEVARLSGSTTEAGCAHAEELIADAQLYKATK